MFKACNKNVLPDNNQPGPSSVVLNPSTCTVVSDDMQSDKRPCAWWQEESVHTLWILYAYVRNQETVHLFIIPYVVSCTVLHVYQLKKYYMYRPTLSSHHERFSVAVNIIS